MAREQILQDFRRLISKQSDGILGFYLMQQALQVFEETCIPEGSMPDDPIMFSTPELRDVGGVWAYVRSVAGEAEEEGPYRHDYADAILVALSAVGVVLGKFPENDERVVGFEKKFGITVSQLDQILNQE